MKKSLIIIIILGLTALLQAQVSKTVQSVNAGTLQTFFTAQEDTTVTTLIITGNIDIRDFAIMRDSLKALKTLDISKATVVNYIDTIYVDSVTTVYDTTKGKTIPVGAFYNTATKVGKTSLDTIVLPDSITSISSDAFEMCTGLTSVIIPNTITTIGNNAFLGCKSLKSVTIPTSVTSIGTYAFQNCTRLTSIVIPSSITAIESGVFFGCSGLTSVAIPSSVHSIGTDAFESCNSLKSITLPPLLWSIGYGAFFRCDSLTAIAIPYSVLSIGVGAFEYCTHLTAVSIGTSDTAIGEYAFYGCTGLKTITANNPKPANLLSSKEVFGGGVDTVVCSLYVPLGTANAYRTANQWMAFEHIIGDILTLADSATSQTILVNATGSWKITSDVSWLTFSPDSGKGNDTIVVTALKNTDSAYRYANITITYSADSSQTIAVTQTKVPQVAANAILLYPNPAKETFTVSLNSDKAEKYTISLFNYLGQTMYETQTDLGNETLVQIPVSTLSSGVYFLRVTGAESVITKQIVVVK